MATEERLTPLQRQANVLDRLDQGHKELHASLVGLDPEDAFLGSRWSVWEVLKHLDAEGFVEALEQISSGRRETLPAFSSRSEKLKADIAHLEETFQRFRLLVEGLPEERLSQLVTPPNPKNSYPGLTLLELVERVSSHEVTHARQIVETRRYVEAFSTRERAVTFIALDPDRPSLIGPSAAGLLKHADYVAGFPKALEAVRELAGGVELVLNGSNIEEIVSRLGRDARAGIWAVVCTIGSPSQAHPELLQAAEKHCDKVVIQTAVQ